MPTSTRPLPPPPGEVAARRADGEGIHHPIHEKKQGPKTLLFSDILEPAYLFFL